MNEIQNELFNKLIFGKFKIIKQEGKGVNSIVFSAKNVISQELVALKIQKKTQMLVDLEKEAYYLFQLKGIGIPKIISYGHSGKYKILVEELLGKSLEQLFIENKKKPKRLRLKDMIMAGLQIINRIEFIHSKNILHLDIKPNNFLVGNPDNSLIYIIDFGFAKKYRSSRTGKHVKFSKNSYFAGNLKYSSINTMKGIMPSRRDDLESIGYMLIYLYRQKLPWDKIICKNKIEFSQKIFDIKKIIPLKLLCEDLPKEMVEYMKYIRGLKFEEEPNYNYLTNILETILEKMDIANDFNFSWINYSLTRKMTISPNKVICKIIRKKMSPFSRKINLRPLIEDRINNINEKTKPKSSNNQKIYVMKENKYFSNEINKNTKQNNKISLSNKSSVNNNLIFEKTTIKYKTINNKSVNCPKRNNTIINQKNKILKLKTYDKKIADRKLIYSRNISKNNNNILNKALNYKSIIKKNNPNYNLFITNIISNKDINIFKDDSKNININLNKLNKKNISLKNSYKNLEINSLYNKEKNNCYNINKSVFLNHKTNYISPIKNNGLLNRNNKEISEGLSIDIIYNRKFKNN